MTAKAAERDARVYARRWRTVAMNADGSRGVSLDARFGGRVSALGWLTFGFLTAGAFVLLIGAALLYLGARRPRDV